MTHHDPMTHLIHRAAEEAVPDDFDLWPTIQTRLRPRRAPLSALRWTGSLTLAVAAALAVIVFAGLLLRSPDPDSDSGYMAAQTGQSTPTLPPTDTLPPVTASPIPDGASNPTALPPTAPPIPGEEMIVVTRVPGDWPTQEYDPGMVLPPGENIDPGIVVPPPGYDNITGTPFIIYPTPLMEVVTATPIPAAGDANSAIAFDADDFNDGRFQTTNSLSPLRPETDRYWIESIPQADFDAAAGGWAVVMATGGFFVPELVVSPRDDAGWSGRYATNTGALLLPASALDQAEITVTSSHAIRRDRLNADERPLSMSGSYQLWIVPAESVIPVNGTPQALTLPLARMRVLSLDGYEGQPVRLTLTVQNDSGTLLPDLALSLPGGRTLALFNPGQARQIALDFVPEADEQRLLLHPLDTSCAADSPANMCWQGERADIELSVALMPLAGDPSMPVPAQPTLPPGSDPRTPTPIAPPSPVASELMVITATPIAPSTPVADEMRVITATPSIPPTPVAALEPYEHVVQPGDDCVSVAYQYGHSDPAVLRVIVELNDLPEDCTLPEPGTTILIPRPTATAIPPGADRLSTPTPIPTLPPTTTLPEGTVAMTLAPSAYSVGVGPLEAETRVDLYASLLLVQLDDENGDPPVPLLGSLGAPLPEGAEPQVITQRIIENAWVVHVEEGGIVTLAVTPQDAVTLQWVLDAQVPLRLERAGRSRSTRITFSMSRADFYAQGLNLDDVVYIQFPVELEMENGTHTASYLISDALITGTGLISGAYQGRPATPGPNEPQLIEVEVAVSGQDADRLQTALDQGRKITVTTTARD